MKFNSWLLLCFSVAMFGVAFADAPKIELVKKEGQLNADMTNPGAAEYPSWFKNSFLDFRDDVKDATAHNKRLVLFFYQDGCPYCKKLLEVNLAQKNIADTLRTRFDVITVNLWGDRDITDVDGAHLIEKKFAEKMRVMYTPTILFFDEQAKVVLRVNGYYEPHKFLAALNYVADKHEAESSFRDYFTKLNPPASSGKLNPQEFFTPPPHELTRVKKTGAKPLLVLFEQQQCPACDELHNDVFKRKETLEQLARFDVVQLDMWSKTPVITPDGRSLSASAWAKELDVKYAPSMLFFGGDGKEVIRTEGYLKSFHNQSVMDYVASTAYKTEPSFQRFIEWRADKLREKGVKINIME
jgi:thioredoxin-related protein